MKNFLFTILAVILLPLAITAQTIDNNLLKEMAKAVPTAEKADVQFSNPKVTNPSLLEWNAIDTVPDPFWSCYFNSTPFVYDPSSKNLYWVSESRSSREVTPGDNFLSSRLGVSVSTNMGASWQKIEVFNGDDANNQLGYITVYPTLAVLNPTGGNDPYQMNYLVFARTFESRPTSQGGVGTDYTGYIFKTDTYSEIETGDYLDPDPHYRLYTSVAASYNDTEEGFVYNAGLPSPDDGYQYGNYGMTTAFFDQDNEYDFYTLQVPDEWATDKFRIPDNNLGSSYNAPMNLAVGNDGTVYAAAHDIFVTDLENRVPGVSKSTDYGETWTNFDPMSNEIFENFLQDNGLVSTYWGNQYVFDLVGSTPYAPSGFAVTGPDEYSFLYQVLTSEEDLSTDTTNHFLIIEVYKKSGAWGINVVSEYYAFNPPMVIRDQGNQTLKDSMIVSSRRNELQLAVTEDGNYLVAKWIDVNPELPVAVDPPFVYEYVGMENNQLTIDTVYATDVFLSYRAIDGGEWSEPKNVTNDERYDKMTYLPSIVPSRTQVPVTSLQGWTYTQQSTSPRRFYDPYIQSMIIDGNLTHSVAFDMFSALVGVEDHKKPEGNGVFTLKDVYPNPATGYAEIGFSIDNPTNTRIELHNSMGQLVDVLQSGNLPAGFHVVTVNTDKYASGVYYYTLIVDGQKLTKVLSIVK